MRHKLIAGNWKLNKTVPESLELARKIAQSVTDISAREILICPPFTSLTAVADIIRNTKVKLGGQDIFWEQSGAFTGEVSGPMLRSAGCEYVIIGHSERRQYFHETDETVNKRVKAALANQLKPIICVGETLQEREKGITEKVVETQVRGAFTDIPEPDCGKIVIAYEPVWAIGTGKNATPDDANKVHRFIRGLMSGLYNDPISGKMLILYGGSMKPENAEDLLKQEHIDGGLIGGASIVADSFIRIIKAGL
ncbi:MAG: triose-phosphate isomerase [bacterium]|nr:triose-phosphate isomerase [bacterium]